MNDHIANLHELVGVLQKLAASTDALTKLLTHEINEVEHLVRDYEIVLDQRATQD